MCLHSNNAPHPEGDRRERLEGRTLSDAPPYATLSETSCQGIAYVSVPPHIACSMLRLHADSQAAYDRFIKRVVLNGEVWLLVMVEHDFPFNCPAHDRDNDVFPFWSEKAYAKLHHKKIDLKLEVVTIQLENFMKTTLPMMIEHGYLAGPNWDSNLAGLEVDPQDMLDRLTRRIQETNS